jgi:4'-phosphopantetheinyl transferase
MGSGVGTQDASRRDGIGGLELRHGEIDVWVAWIAEAFDSDLAARCRQVLTADELRRSEKFHFDKDRRRHLVTRALVRYVLSRYGSLPPAAWRFQATEFGRPFVVNDDPVVQRLSFNLSHSDKVVMMGVAHDAELGIDVEDLQRKVSLDIATSYFSADEVRQLHALPPARQSRRFLEFWTLKESYVKAQGKGLSIPLDTFGFDLSADDRLVAHFADDLHPQNFHPQNLQPQQTQWRFWQWSPCVDSIAALCVTDAPGVNWRIKARRTIPFVFEAETPVVMGRTS